MGVNRQSLIQTTKNYKAIAIKFDCVRQLDVKEFHEIALGKSGNNASWNFMNIES